jgi:hypothetical protein
LDNFVGVDRAICVSSLERISFLDRGSDIGHFLGPLAIMGEGWNVRVTTIDGAGRPVLFRHYLVFEADRDRAIALVKLDMTVNVGERVEVHEPVDRGKFLAQCMKLGDVKQHV